MSDNALQDAIRRLAGGESLSSDATAAAFDVVMGSEASPAQVAALLIGLRVKGETADEVAGGARALRHAMIALRADQPGELVDSCGTGVGRVSTLNISTAAALLAAGAGIRVAKHGNRSFTSRCGSADVLEALGVPLQLTPAAMEATLAEAGIVFMFAPLMHPAMKHVGPVRRELAIPTLMNILGPLANPASAGRQVIGVAEEHRMPLLAGALATLGTIHALVVHGAPGMDEFSALGRTRVLEVRSGRITEWTIDPADFGLSGSSVDELAGGGPQDNAALVTGVLSGSRWGGPRAAVLLNAAAALYVGGRSESFGAALPAAEEGLAARAGIAALDGLRRAAATRVWQ